MRSPVVPLFTLSGRFGPYNGPDVQRPCRTTALSYNGPNVQRPLILKLKETYCTTALIYNKQKVKRIASPRFSTNSYIFALNAYAFWSQAFVKLPVGSTTRSHA